MKMLILTTFIEYIALITLIQTLDVKQEKEIIKIVATALLASIEVGVADYFKIPIAFVLNYGFLILIITLLFQRKIFDILLEFITTMIILIITEILLIFIISLIAPMLSINNASTRDIIGSLTTLAITLCLCKRVPLRKYYIRYKNELNKMYFLLFNLVFCIVITKLIWEFNSKLLVKYSLAIVLVITLFVIINCVFIVYNTKLKEQAKALETYNKYSPIVSNLIEDTKRKQHDFKNHLNTIYGLVQTADGDNLKGDLENYLKSLNTSLHNIDEIIAIDNKVVSAIIYCKMCAAIEQNINFYYDVRFIDTIPLKDFELSEILNNVLDNAFEAVNKLASDDKEVYIKIGFEDNYYFIETKNKGLSLDITTDSLYKLFNKGFTTKKGADHGYGLFNVKKIVELYNGQVQLSFEDDYIHIRLIIPT